LLGALAMWKEYFLSELWAPNSWAKESCAIVPRNENVYKVN